MYRPGASDPGALQQGPAPPNTQPQEPRPPEQHPVSSAVSRLPTASAECGGVREESMQPAVESSPGRRSINSSKRAAQNRAAQRAFRLRRERYVAGLEEKARSYDRLEAAYIGIQRENYQLRAALHKMQAENSILRVHFAVGTSAPVPAPPPAPMTHLAAAPFSPVADAVPGHNSAPQYLAVRPIALAEPGTYLHPCYSPGHHPKQPHLQQDYQARAPGYPGAGHFAPQPQAVGPAYPPPPHDAHAAESIWCQQQQQQQQHVLRQQTPKQAVPYQKPSLQSRAPSPVVPTQGLEPAMSPHTPDVRAQPRRTSSDLSPAPTLPLPAASAPVLPSVREITMAIGATAQAGAYPERDTSPTQPRPGQGRSGGSREAPAGEYIEPAKRRPW